MINTLFHQYQINVLEQHKVSKKITLLKTDCGYFALKEAKDERIDTIVSDIEALHLTMFVPVLKTVSGKYRFQYHDRYYYLMPWLDNRFCVVEELKLKHYFSQLAQLHNDTFYVVSVGDDYFSKQMAEMKKALKTKNTFYERLMVESENADFKRAWHWLMIEMYPLIYHSLEKAGQLVTQYDGCVKEKKTCRLCFTYNHFDLDHFCVAEKKLLSIDDCAFLRPPSDLLSIYRHLADEYLDFENVESFYLKYFTLYEDEKLWLAIYLLLLPTFVWQEDDVMICYRLEQVRSYLLCVDKIVKKLGFS